MSLTQRINEDAKTAMKAKDKETLKVIRMLKAALQKEQLEHAEPLTAEQELTIITREMKQRKDSLAEFMKAERQDLVETVQAEIAIVERYLPKQLSPEEITAAVQTIITELNATKADFGAVMSKAMAQLKGQADGQVVNQTVKSLLG
ncbi:GatB/YqeY domain-containing protein [Aerococcaceae bacterium NML190073]|nr:GatB/YqeY domain-containing protein [Aerococcaceae bacterium NML190073]MCW6679715.1 GatB/YqeY domain-containing protein [Aerococcaceae bacterium NML130460]